MIPAQCSHCGKPVFTGFLCSDCQALRAYQPQLFAADGFPNSGRVRLHVDRNAIFSATVVLAACFAMILLWPQIQRLLSRPSSSAEPSAAVVDQFSKKLNLDAYRKELNTDSGGAAANETSPSFSAPAFQNSYKGGPDVPQPFAPRPVLAPAPTFMEPVAFVGNWENQARSTFDVFLANYCSQRSTLINGPVTPTSIMFLPNGTGAVVAFDESGSFRQGTAQYSPEAGWAWILSPDSKIMSH